MAKKYDKEEKEIIANIIEYIAMQQPTKTQQMIKRDSLNECWNKIYIEGEE